MSKEIQYIISPLRYKKNRTSIIATKDKTFFISTFPVQGKLYMATLVNNEQVEETIESFEITVNKSLDAEVVMHKTSSMDDIVALIYSRYTDIKSNKYYHFNHHGKIELTRTDFNNHPRSNNRLTIASIDNAKIGTIMDAMSSLPDVKFYIENISHKSIQDSYIDYMTHDYGARRSQIFIKDILRDIIRDCAIYEIPDIVLIDAIVSHFNNYDIIEILDKDKYRKSLLDISATKYKNDPVQFMARYNNDECYDEF